METKHWIFELNGGYFDKVFVRRKRQSEFSFYETEFWFDDFEGERSKERIGIIFNDERLNDDEKIDLIQHLFIIDNMIKDKIARRREERIAKVSFNKSGGTAKGKAITNRVTIPTSWIKALGINEENREVKLTCNNGKIIIEKVESCYK